MENQITYLKAVLLWLSWQLIWTKMDQNIPYKVKKLILMAVIHNVLNIKLLHYLFYHTGKWCILRLATMEVKMSPHMKWLCSGICSMKFWVTLRVEIKNLSPKLSWSMRIVQTIVWYKRFLELILSHQRWSDVRCITMTSIGCPSELVLVTEIFSKAFVMGCVL